MTTIIVPSRYPDIFEDCRRSLDACAPLTHKILVRDGHDIIDPSGWQTIQAPDGPFIYSRNVNLGINQTKDSVLLMNDDVRFNQPGTIETLEHVMESYPDIGILSPRTLGGVGNVDQARARGIVHYTNQRLAFVCVLIRRAVIEQIGLLDERFVGYGWDDVDFCRRAVNAKWKMACTALTTVKHGHREQTYSSSYLRQSSDIRHREYQARVLLGRSIYQQKWGDCKHENFQ